MNEKRKNILKKRKRRMRIKKWKGKEKGVFLKSINIK